MAKFTIDFETDPETRGPWQGRKSARVKMIQSITDYLSSRCGCDNVVLTEVVDVVVQPPKVSSAKRFSRKAI